MQFVAKEDVDAPIENLFQALSDFEGMERSAIRRGIELQRRGNIAEPANGLGWDAEFKFRGSQRKIAIDLSSFTPSTEMVFAGEGSGLSSEMTVELIELSPRRTRLSVKMQLKPKTLSGRLMLQSLKLVRSKISRKFKARIGDYVEMALARKAQVA